MTDTQMLVDAARAKAPGDREPVDRALVELADACDAVEERIDAAVEEALVGHGDDCVDQYDVEDPHSAVDRWLDRQKLLGITAVERACVERLLEDLS